MVVNPEIVNVVVVTPKNVGVEVGPNLLDANRAVACLTLTQSRSLMFDVRAITPVPSRT